MTLQEIDNRISEIQWKLTHKVEFHEFRKSSKHRERKLPKHLKLYLENELKQLQAKRISLLSQVNKKIIIEMAWQNVIFFNGYITFAYEKKIYKLPHELSKKSYNYIKPFLSRLSLKPIQVIINKGQIVEIKNKEEIGKCFEIIRLDNILIEIPKIYTESFLKNIVGSQSQLTNDDIIKAYDLKKKSVYFNYLCNTQIINYKIIPVTEFTYHSDGQLFSEEGFLFTITLNRKMLIIWESIYLSRSTYIFRIKQSNYYKYLYEVLFFISAKTLNKRLTLKRHKGSFFKNFEKYATINHEGLSNWKTRLITCS